ncbi:hypothetical protein RJT34_22007 [Clitoria ternatea]|uniref:Uncharacterized protein n=1 Tax=Clitoria ternatea TaxID=43366 RepID=A0AAN9P6R8_CLITE
MLFNENDPYWQRVGYKMVALEEASGGTWCLTLQDADFTISIMNSCSQIVTPQILKGVIMCVVSQVYASPTPSRRELLWDHIDNLSHDQHLDVMAGNWAKATNNVKASLDEGVLTSDIPFCLRTLMVGGIERK